jgi:hypothetical protein
MRTRVLFLLFAAMALLSIAAEAQAQQIYYVEFPTGQIRKICLGSPLPAGTTKAKFQWQGIEYMLKILDPNELMRQGVNLQDIPSVETANPAAVIYPADQQTPQRIIAQYLGIQISTAGIVLSAVVIFLGILIVGVVTKSDIGTLLTALVLTSIFGVLNYIPLWICLLVGILLAIWLLERAGAK